MNSVSVEEEIVVAFPNSLSSRKVHKKKRPHSLSQQHKQGKHPNVKSSHNETTPTVSMSHCSKGNNNNK